MNMPCVTSHAKFESNLALNRTRRLAPFSVHNEQQHEGAANANRGDVAEMRQTVRPV